MIRVVFDQWPLLVTTGIGTLSEEDMRAACDGFEAAFQRGGRFVSLVDGAKLDAMPNALIRKKYGEWRATHALDLRRHVIAVAIVVGERPLVRAAFTALSWFAPHPSPEAIFGEYDVALGWCRKLLKSEGR